MSNCTSPVCEEVAIAALSITLLVGIGFTLVTLITCCLLFRIKKDLRVLSECPPSTYRLTLGEREGRFVVFWGGGEAVVGNVLLCHAKFYTES